MFCRFFLFICFIYLFYLFILFILFILFLYFFIFFNFIFLFIFFKKTLSRQTTVAQKFPECRHSIVGSFLFLRLLCPLIVTPLREWEGIPDPIPTTQKKGLVLMSKILQNISNGTFLREHNTEFVNEWLKKNQSTLQDFFDRFLFIYFFLFLFLFFFFLFFFFFFFFSFFLFLFFFFFSFLSFFSIYFI